jgi:hypothetical protein
MNTRVLIIAILVLIGGPTSAAPAARSAPSPAARPALKAGPAPPMVFYVVKGAPDACGRGCDSWIAAEGQIDSGAALRFRKFWTKVRDRKLPIYFSSPGGNLDQALAMGTMLRERPVVARVARTVVRECGFEAQNGDVCVKLKQSGRELHGDLWTRNAMCNSACPYLILGAATREIAPDALLAVHSPKVVAHFRNGVPTPQMQAEANARGRERADRMIKEYIAKMGVEMGLLVLARTVKFEDMHVLTRDEIVRFGIDMRPLTQTAWTLEAAARPFARKLAVAKRENGASFRTMEWRLFCENKDRARLMFLREVDQGPAGTSTVIVMAGSEKAVAFGRYPARIGKFDVWSDTIASDPMKAMLGVPRLQIGEGALMPDGKTNLVSFDIDTDGLATAWTQLAAACPAGPSNNARPAIASPVSGAVPAR